MKSLIVSLLLLLNISVGAQQNNFSCSFNHLALSVKDLDASITFYKNVFGFNEITNRSAVNGIRWMSMGEEKELHLITTIKEPVTINKAVHLALTATNYDAFVNHLKELSVVYSDWPGNINKVNSRADGVKQVYFQDPDGYWIEVNNSYAPTPSVDEIRNTVWKLEENYWKYVLDKDLESYTTLWDDQFLGYPSTNVIAGKDHITDWITDLYKDPSRHFNYELQRKVENVFGDIVIVLYDVTQIWTSDNKPAERKTYKITHTWKKTDKGWLIIGGMGALK